MPSLSDKLKSLGVQVGAKNLASPKPRNENKIEQVLPGRRHQTSAGETYIVETLYNLDYAHGKAPVRGLGALDNLAAWAREDRLCKCQPEGFAYLDIETTGLMGGTGTYAFLIGAGKLTPDGFILAQFFMRDPREEPAQLMALEEFLAPCEAVVTYNGKAFDVPILNTRYITQGWLSPFLSLAHVDLLPLARKLWRDRLPSRTLGNIETSILGAHRAAEDVPGWMIPQLFFDYLRDGDARPLVGVFYHNAMDVVAMAALLNHMTHLLADPLQVSVENNVDLIGLGRFYEDLGRIEEAADLYRRGLDQGLPEEVFWATLERLSFIHKRAGVYEKAIHLWEQAAEHKHVFAHIELAKYYEHHVRDVEAALTWTQSALEALNTYPYGIRQQWLGELEHRQARLVRKRGNRSDEAKINPQDS